MKARASEKSPNKTSRSPEVGSERPHRVFETVLAAWLGQAEIHGPFKRAVEALDAATGKPLDLARCAGSLPRARVVGETLEVVAAYMPSGRRAAVAAADAVLRWPGLPPVPPGLTLDQRLAHMAEGVRELQAVELALRPDDCAFAEAVHQARRAFYYWTDDDKPGNPAALTSKATRLWWSMGAVALGRRFAECCLKCGKPVSRTPQRDYHDACRPRLRPRVLLNGETTTPTDPNEKAVERLMPLLRLAVEQRLTLLYRGAIRDRSVLGDRYFGES